MRFTGVLALALIPTLAIIGCSSETTVASTSIDLSGAYNLQSIQISGQTEPNSSGTLNLTGSNYDAALTVNGQVEPEDVGSYEISGTDTWSQTSTTTGVHSAGTFSLVGTTLTITLTSPTSTVEVWVKGVSP